MWGRAPRTISPSVLSSRRSTPWVAGCWGPMLTSISSGPMSSSRQPWFNGGRGLPPYWPSTCRFCGVKSKGPTPIVLAGQGPLGHLLRRLHPQAVVELGVHPVLAQRVAAPVVGEQDPAQVRVAAEGDAEEVEGLALVPVGHGPEPLDGVDAGLLARQVNLDAKRVSVAVREQVVDHLDPRRILLGPVHRREVHQVVEGEVGVLLQVATHVRRWLGGHDDEGRGPVENRSDDLARRTRRRGARGSWRRPSGLLRLGEGRRASSLRQCALSAFACRRRRGWRAPQARTSHQRGCPPKGPSGAGSGPPG